MKKTKLLLAAAALSLASAASADQVGGRIGFPGFGLGVQYQQDSGLRYGLDLPLIGLFSGGGAFAISGDVSYLIPFGTATNSFSPYYGFGLGLGLGIASAGGSSAGAVSLYPNGIIGGNFDTGTAWTPFIEGSVGPTIFLGSGGAGGIGIGYGVRAGVNYRLN